ncbi:MAG TPA: GTP-binding protein, partial [Pirellulaceae bacterium]|nr:GTP-binding protein [Pirellulaceae bacterium]
MAKSTHSDETWFSLLTAPATGAIAVTIVVGPQAASTLTRHFTSNSGRSLMSAREGQLYYGRWSSIHDEGLAAAGEDLIICRVGQDVFEIHSHSGNFARQVLHSDLLQSKLVSVGPDEALRRLATNRWQADAQWALTQTITQTGSRLLSSQLQAWETFPDRLISQLEQKRWIEVRAEIDTMVHWATFANRLIEPPWVVLCGPPNAGKSTLINRLLGFDRAIVHEQPGTTRDVLTQVAAVDGWPIQLTDTAGLRSTTDPLESVGIQQAQHAIHRAAIVVYVVDGAKSIDGSHIETLPRVPDLVVVNKCDLIDERDSSDTVAFFQTAWGNGHAELPILTASALTGHGIESITTTIANLLVPQLPPPGVLLCASPSAIQRLQTLQSALLAEDTQLSIA